MSKKPTAPPEGATRMPPPPNLPRSKQAGTRVVKEQLEKIAGHVPERSAEQKALDFAEDAKYWRERYTNEAQTHTATREARDADAQRVAVEHSNQLAAIRAENDALREGLTNAGVAVGELRGQVSELENQLSDVRGKLLDTEGDYENAKQRLDVYLDAEEATRP